MLEKINLNKLSLLLTVSNRYLHPGLMYAKGKKNSGYKWNRRQYMGLFMIEQKGKGSKKAIVEFLLLFPSFPFLKILLYPCQCQVLSIHRFTS